MKIIKFTISTVLIFICFTSFSQIKVLSSGNTQMGGSSAHTGATLNLYSNNGTTIRSDVNHSFGWGDAIKSYVNRSTGIAYSAWYNGSRTFAVFGNGDVWSSTGIYTSDSTLKTSIQNVENSMGILNSLRGVIYNMKNDKNRRIHAGLLAQEVETILPEIVYEDDKGIKGIAYVELI